MSNRKWLRGEAFADILAAMQRFDKKHGPLTSVEWVSVLASVTQSVIDVEKANEPCP